MRLRRTVWALVLSVAFVTTVQAVTCSFTGSDGTFYDLSPLTYNPSLPSPPGYNITDNGENTFFLNFCNEVSNTNLKSCNKYGPNAVCELSADTYYQAGTLPTQQFSDIWSDNHAPARKGQYTSGISLSYSQGDYCQGQGVDRSTVIMVACDPQEENGGLYGVYNSGSCSYILYYASSYACKPGVTISPTPSASPMPKRPDPSFPMMPCTFTSSNGTKYDLTSLSYHLTDNSPSGYSIVASDGSTFYMNFCNPVSWKQLPQCSKKGEGLGAVCQEQNGEFYSTGAVTAQKFSTDWSDQFAPPNSANYTSGISVTYEYGDFCSKENRFRHTTIMVACSPGEENGGLYGVHQDRHCGYILYFASSNACSVDQEDWNNTPVDSADNTDGWSQN